MNVATFSKLNATLVILSLASVFILPSQSASSFITYFLAISVVVSARILWTDARDASALIGFILVLLIYLPLTSFWSEPFSGRGLFSIAIRSFLILAFILTFAVSLSRVVWFEGVLARAICICSAIAGFAALGQFLIHPPEDGRLNGLGELDTHVIAALVFGVGLLFSLVVMSGKRMSWRVIGGISALILIPALALSGSRNAWISVAIGVITYLLSHRVRNPKAFLGILALILACSGGVLIGLIHFFPVVEDFLMPRGVSFRPLIWRSIWHSVLEDDIWFGRGILTSGHVLAGGTEFLHPHNMYLAVLYHGGVLGWILYLSLLGNMVMTFLKNYAEGMAKLGFSVLMIGLFAYTLDGWKLIDKVSSSWFLVWMPVGIAIQLQMDRLYTPVTEI